MQMEIVKDDDEKIKNPHLWQPSVLGRNFWLAYKRVETRKKIVSKNIKNQLIKFRIMISQYYYFVKILYASSLSMQMW